MKKTKIALTLVCAVLLVAASVMGTLAYLTASTNAVVNTFSIGNVSFDKEVGTGLDEAKTDAYGVAVTPAERITENEYKLIPGHTYTKDPTVHMSSTTEDAYLFVTVDNQIKDIEVTQTDAKSIAKQMEALGWKQVPNTTNVYVYYGTTTTKDDETQENVTKVNTSRAKVTKDQDIVVFNTFTLADEADVEETISVADGDNGTKLVNKYADGQAKITIKAYAIQAEGLESATDAAVWANFTA